MKHKISQLFVAAFIAANLPACSGFLDTPPIRQETDTNQLSTAKGVEKVLFSAYGTLASEQLLGKNIPLVGELLADNLNFSRLNGTNYAAFATKTFSATDVFSQEIWDNAYQAIFLANTVIEAVDGNKFTEAGQIGQQYKGEALFVRSLLFFELTQLFALPYSNNPNTDLGIVLRLTPTPKSPVEVATKVGRSTVQQSYDQIIKDLTQAISLLPEKNGNRAYKTAAKALLARVYFSMNKYTEAYNLADEILKAQPTTWKLTEPFTNFGDNMTNGVIFQVVNTPTQDNSTNFKKLYFDSNKEKIILPIAEEFVTAIRNNTSRAGNRWLLFVGTDATLPYTTKFNKATGNTNLPYLRLAEMYLIKAEAGLQAKKIDVFAARREMNVLRKIAEGIEDNAVSNDEILLEFIQEERRIELAFEGNRYHELRRQKKAIRNIPFNDKRHLLKLPLSEINANPTIEQN